MWKKGEIPSENIKKAEYICLNEKGERVSLQSRVTAYWPDGSVKWTGHSADSEKLGKEIEVKLSFDPKEASDAILLHDEYELKESKEGFVLKGRAFEVCVKKDSNELFESVKSGERVVFAHAKPVLKLEEPVVAEHESVRKVRDYEGRIESVTIEETGSILTVVKYEGVHVCKASDKKEDLKIPFILRMFVGTAAGEIRFQHTFLYDGDENKDFLKGIGIVFESPISGPLYNRHVKFLTDAGALHEVSLPLQSWRPRIPEALYIRQMEGKFVTDEDFALCKDPEIKEKIETITENAPHWDTWSMTQDSSEHFRIRKKLEYDDVCMIDALNGKRSPGGVSFGSNEGSVMIGIRDFWEKNPGGVSIQGLTGDIAKAYIWFYSPEAESFDFRHYAHRGYNQVCYEGYDYKGADPVGIAVTSECAIGFDNSIIPEDELLIRFSENIDNPPVYVADPGFYHDMRAFGYWSMEKKDNEMECWLEEQLDRAFSFYKEEVEQRGWYGLFNYGDFMHTYDKYRHQWKYDVGGYAWDNTELVPTLWLWNYFLRTGREDVFTLSEKLSRHASEVDVYHFGKYKGLGSRHNVRHWGCPCKEARIAMAAHHRVLYYLTGDRRLEDIFEELKDNENSFLNKDPLGDFYDKKDMVFPSHARSGPDWSSLVSNWMTEWERKNDVNYKNKIMTGIHDLEKTPLRLASGPDFEFDPKTVHLSYIGERTTGGNHLQVCMGAPTVWMETADLIDYPAFKQMLIELGRFALLPRDRQLEECKGIIGEREYTFPFMFTGLGAYASANLIAGDCEGVMLGKDVISKDHAKEGHKAAERTWRSLLASLISENNAEGFELSEVKDCGNHPTLKEIPWISTNFVAQWCLNVIIALDFIREDLPTTVKAAEKLVQEKGDTAFHRA